MPFIGNQPALSFTSFAKQDFTTSATTSYTLDNPVANANELALFINNVRQEPTTAYSASGTSLTLTEATSVGDDMYAIFLGKAIQTVNPPNNSVGTAQLVDDAVTFDKMTGQNYPAFCAYLSAFQGIANNTYVKAQFNTKVFDTDNAYDNSTNYRFTVPSGKGGKYNFYAQTTLRNNTGNNLQYGYIALYVNGNDLDTHHKSHDYFYTTLIRRSTQQINTILDLSAGDYVEVYAKLGDGNHNISNTGIMGNDNDTSAIFHGMRIGD